MGSEFAFEDFSSQEVGKYSYRWLRDEPCGDRTCHVVERRPLYKHSGYTRMVAWTEKTDYQLVKVDFYDRKNELLKTLTLTEYRLYLEKYWRAHDLYMVNHVSNKTTRLKWTNYESTGGGVTFGLPACLLHLPTFFRRICLKFREKMQNFLEIHT